MHLLPNNESRPLRAGAYFEPTFTKTDWTGPIFFKSRLTELFNSAGREEFII